MPTLRAAMGGGTTGHHWDGATIAYRKAQKAHDPDDCERWEEADAVDTLSSHSTVSGSAVVQPYTVHSEHSSAMTCNGDAPAAFATDQARALDTNGGYAHSQGGTVVEQEMAVRRLLPVECERLQGFPDGWTDGESDSARYRLLGNAVCVPVAEWIGRRMAALAGDE